VKAIDMSKRISTPEKEQFVSARLSGAVNEIGKGTLYNRRATKLKILTLKIDG
jgi:hypothetical protein